MRIGIYNRHLATLGGGEKHMGVLAEVLSKDYEVDILTYDPIDKETLEERLRLETLSRVEIRCMPNVSNEIGAQVTADYDLFINASYMSSLPSLAKKSIYLTYFPTPFGRYLSLTKKVAIKMIGPMARAVKKRNYVVWGPNFYSRQLSKVGTYRWTGGTGTLTLKLPSGEEQTVNICLGGKRQRGVPQPQISFFIDGLPVFGPVELPPRRNVVYKIKVPPGVAGRSVQITIESDTYCPKDAGVGDDKRVLGVPVRWVRLRRGPQYYIQRIADIAPPRLYTYPTTLAFLDTYDEIVSISVYTQYWVKRYWGRDSTIIFPPVDTGEFTPGNKENIIMSVGRFWAGRDNKKQLIMIKTFTEMCKEGLTGWEYHLFGGTHSGSEHKRYLEKVMKAARGYPVFIHANASYTELKEFYGKSKIFWHASGYGEDEEANPESFEHFGITTVEAMASGCVPVVIAKAGQRETVEDGKSGFLWETVEEMKKKTRRLADDGEFCRRMAEAAVHRADVFSKERFAAGFRAIVAKMLKPERA